MRAPSRAVALLGAASLILATPTLSAGPAAAALPTPAPIAGVFGADDYVEYADVVIGPDGTTTVAASVWSAATDTSHVVTSSRPPHGSWSAAVSLGGASVESTEPDIAIGADGTTTIGWRDTLTEDDPVVMASTRPPGGSWSAPQPLSATAVDEYTSGGDDPEVRLAAAGDGTVTAVWPQWITDHFEIQSATRSTAGAWSAPITLDAREDWTYRTPAVAAGPDGTVAAVWGQQGVGTYVATRHGGGAWDPPVRLGDDYWGGRASIAFAPDGTLGVLWASGNNTPTITTLPPGGDWATPRVFSTVTVEGDDLELAAGPGPSFTAAWTSYESGDWDQMHVYVATGGTSGPWTTTEIGQPTSGSPRVAVTSDGTATAIWQGQPPSSSDSDDLLTSSRPPGGGWATPTTLHDVPATSYVSPVALAAGPAGSLAALWTESAGGEGSDISTITYAVVVDPAVPDTGAIAGPKTIKPKKAGAFTFTGPAGATYECRVDTTLKQQHGITGKTRKARKKSKQRGKQPVPWAACSSPYSVNAKALKLKKGKHTLYVRASQYGATDPTPSALRFKVKR